MSKVILLGCSNAIPAADAHHTHLVVLGEERIVLVDSGSNPIVQLEREGVDINHLSDIIVTHFHPDHVSGLPLLLMDMWLMGRRTPVNIHGLDHALDRFEGLMDFYNWREWPDFFPVAFHRLPLLELSSVLECDDFRVLASPVRHMIPAIGLRFEFKKSGRVLAYSCDTEPCDEVARLSEHADVLLHESTGESYGHSSPRQAGEIAARAQAGRLCLIHYPTGKYASGNLISEAQKTFSGEVDLARDLMVLDFSNGKSSPRIEAKKIKKTPLIQPHPKPYEP